MMTVNIGIIGVGMIGADHAHRLTHVVSGAHVAAVSDTNHDRARTVAATLPAARAHETGHDLIAAPGVDAVVVASAGDSHEEYVVAAVDVGKPVFCEKPLAPTQDACLRIVASEVRAGRRLVQVGFMRRFDAGYRAMRTAVEQGRIGTPLLAHCVHRNAAAPPHFTREMPLTDSAVHEIDVVRWLFDDEIAAVRVLTPRRTSAAGPDLPDPLLVLLETTSGATVDAEVFLNCGYGYDIGCEVVGEQGTVRLADPADVETRKQNARSARVPADWRERFAGAYDVELAEWVASVTTGCAAGPSSWDGYAASAVSDACVESLRTGHRVEVALKERPDLYA